MKTLTLFILISVSVASLSMGQKKDREVYPKQISIAHNEAVRNFSQDFVTAFLNNFSLDDLNQATGELGQLSVINMKGDYNFALMLQRGFNNTGIINIVGNKNEATLEQKGNGLFSILNVYGRSNQLHVVQRGQGLKNGLQLSGSGINVGAFQNNNGMMLIQRGAGAIPLTIHQTGQTTPIIIRNN
ncbi:MAG TPA: hypothetical protein VFG39_06020 [Balneolaceae bacterium]|nr:hypothetical protein [Balneolaceae bacterium]